jgi:hypothetical protein
VHTDLFKRFAPELTVDDLDLVQRRVDGWHHEVVRPQPGALVSELKSPRSTSSAAESAIAAIETAIRTQTDITTKRTTKRSP